MNLMYRVYGNTCPPLRVLLAVVLLAFAGCATAPKPQELQAFEALRGHARSSHAVEVAPDQMAQADHLLDRSRAQWENDDLEDSAHTALLGQAAIHHALALADQADAKKRIKRATDDRAQFEVEAEKLEFELKALQEQVALLERLSKQKAEIDEQHDLASEEKQRLNGRIEEERAKAEASSKVKTAEVALKESETVGAPKYAKEAYDSAVEFFKRAQAELEKGDIVAARASADFARQKAAAAVAEATPLHNEHAAHAQQRAQIDALAREAAALSVSTLRRDARGALQRLIIEVPGNQLFPKTHTTTLGPAAASILGQIAMLLKKYPDFPVQVIGHTDSRGRSDALLARSLARAQSVYSTLVSDGVEARRMVVTGKGGEDPVSDNRHRAGRLRNDRIEIVFMYQ